jgi:3',5'-cyclic AMP phosphodiesterase CpdA
MTPETTTMPTPRRLIVPLLAAALLAPAALRAHDGEGDHEHAPKPVSEADAHRPSAIPDRIILTWTGDPARSQAVTWRTDASVAKAKAQLALADHGPKFVAEAKDVPAVTMPLASDLGKAHYHTAEFADLKPATAYAYRVGDGANWSEWFHFRTAAEAPEPFAFIYFGDAQNDIKSLWSRVIRGAYSDAPRARFIVHAGDLVNRGNRDAEWGEWFGGAGWVNGMVPSVPTPGNHEYPAVSEEKDAKRSLSNHWRPQFALPEHGPAGLEETCYTFDYQGVRIVALNSNEKHEEQAAWLDRVLADNPCRWTIATFHHPIFSSAKERDNAKLRALWQPLFDKHKVDLVLQGHDHTYARSGLTIANVPTGTQTQDARGTVYVVSVSGPKMYDLKREPWMRRKAEDTQLYQIIHIDGDRLRYEARTALGTRYDAFTLTKRADAPNLMVEDPIDLPERLRAPKPAAAAAAGD